MLRCLLAGGAPYSNAHFYRNLSGTGSDGAKRFTLSMSFRFSQTTFNNQGGTSIIQLTTASQVTSYYASAPAPVNTYRPIISEPVTTYFAPAPMTAYRPAIDAPVTTYYSPAPITAYRAAIVGPVTTYYAPTPVAVYRPVVSKPVTTYYAPSAAAVSPVYVPVRRGLFGLRSDYLPAYVPAVAY